MTKRKYIKHATEVKRLKVVNLKISSALQRTSERILGPVITINTVKIRITPSCTLKQAASPTNIIAIGIGSRRLSAPFFFKEEDLHSSSRAVNDTQSEYSQIYLHVNVL